MKASRVCGLRMRVSTTAQNSLANENITQLTGDTCTPVNIIAEWLSLTALTVPRSVFTFSRTCS